MRAHDPVGAAAKTRGVLFALHLGRFADDATRGITSTVLHARTS